MNAGAYSPARRAIIFDCNRAGPPTVNGFDTLMAELSFLFRGLGTELRGTGKLDRFQCNDVQQIALNHAMRELFFPR